MDRKHNKDLTERARELRKNMTPEGKHLWYDFLRDYPMKIYRQKVIDDYIVDFYCREANIVIEVDGSQHYTEEGQKYDENRTSVLENRGLRVLRFTNYEIRRDFSSVCQAIESFLKQSK